MQALAAAALGAPPEPPAVAAQVAVIVVHGVADQQPGETASAFVDLMIASAPGGICYVAGEVTDFTLPVPPMSPELPFDYKAQLPPYPPGATPSGRDRGFRRSLSLSIKSDFQREATTVSSQQDGSWVRMRGRFRERFASTPLAPMRAAADRGLAYTQYLLSKAVRNDSPAEHYASKKTRLIRRSGGAERAIDVFEMYWADQSRLAGAIPRVLTEMFTMFFRLSRLGRDAVDEASRYADSNRTTNHRAWTSLSWLQTLIDWSFTNVLAQLFGQLLLVGLFLIAVGLAGPALPLRYGGIALIVLALIGAAYFAKAKRGLRVALGVGVIGAVIVALPTWGFGVALLVLLTVVLFAGLRAADDRFPFVFFSGGVLWGALVCATLGRMLGSAIGGDPWDALVQGGLTAFEFVLWLIKWWWIVMAAPIALWGMLSMALTVSAWRGGDYQRRGSAATGRLGTLLSLASFLLVAMALWAALGSALQHSLAGRSYSPAIWTQEGPASADICRQATKAGPSVASGNKAQLVALRDAAEFTQCRFQGSTSAFSVIALLLLLIVAYMLVLITPSILAELQWASSDKQTEARRLGRWLTWFYRHLDRVILAVTAVGTLAILFVGYRFSPASGGQTDTLSREVAVISQQLLHWLVIPAASAFAVLSILGGVISRLVPGIRAPLDAALDVDNHMREFPRQAIPRARIFSRYAALLAAVKAGRYERIVVVSHSQGTVISTEMLRYISSTTTQRGQSGRPQRLKELLECQSIRMLTLGCPLRQLYAARFPTLYEWVLDTERRPNGPSADDIGVDVWVNAFGSGDYVGRWLWSQHVDGLQRYHPLYDGVGHLLPRGRQQAYDLFDPMPPTAAELQRLREYETCIGFAAHTHYFDPPRRRSAVSVVALLADQLIAGPGETHGALDGHP